MELQRQMGFGRYQTAWSWLHKIRKAMVAPGRQPLAGPVEADETLVGGARPGKPGRGAAGKAAVAGAVEASRGRGRGRRLGRLRMQAVPNAAASSLKGFLADNVAKPAAITTDGWKGHAGLEGFDHQAINLSRAWGDAALRLPGIHLVFGLVKRWLLGPHHGAVSKKHLQAGPWPRAGKPDPGSTSTSSASTAAPPRASRIASPDCSSTPSSPHRCPIVPSSTAQPEARGEAVRPDRGVTGLDGGQGGSCRCRGEGPVRWTNGF